MEMKVRVRTPVGHAKVTSERIDIRHLLLIGTKAKIKDRYISPDNDEFVWTIEVPVRNYHRVQRNLAIFSMGTYKILKGIAGSRIVKKFMKEGQEEELDKMLRETKIEIRKQQDMREVVNELTKETKWQSIKNRFTKVKEDWVMKKNGKNEV